jgi:enterochelin esterase-like enzyme
VLEAADSPVSPFLTEPYVQLHTPGPAADGTDQLNLVWHTPAEEEEGAGGWLVRWEDSTFGTIGRMRRSTGALRPQSALAAPSPGVAPHRVWRCELGNLTPGAPTKYEVWRGVGGIPHGAEELAAAQQAAVGAMGADGAPAEGARVFAGTAWSRPDWSDNATRFFAAEGKDPFFKPVNAPGPDGVRNGVEVSPRAAFAAAQVIGVSHRTFYSAAFGADVGYCVYLPPGYDVGDAHLPVIYNLHGAGGNEFHSFEDVRCLHEGIVAGRWPPALVVLPNGGWTWYKNSHDGRFPVETMIIDELLPHVDATYRTVAGRHGRAIEGYSMGGRGATRLAIKHPGLFCSLHNQAGNVPATAEMGGAPAAWRDFLSGYLGPDKSRYEADDVFLLLARNLPHIKGKLRIQIGCGTMDDSHLPTCRAFHEALLVHGVDHTYAEYEGMGHAGSPAMIALNRAQWFDYHFESMRHAAADLPAAAAPPPEGG